MRPQVLEDDFPHGWMPPVLGAFFSGHFSCKAESVFKMGWVSFSSPRLSAALRGSERLGFGK